MLGTEMAGLGPARKKRRSSGEEGKDCGPKPLPPVACYALSGPQQLTLGLSLPSPILPHKVEVQAQSLGPASTHIPPWECIGVLGPEIALLGAVSVVNGSPGWVARYRVRYAYASVAVDGDTPLVPKESQKDQDDDCVWGEFSDPSTVVPMGQLPPAISKVTAQTTRPITDAMQQNRTRLHQISKLMTPLSEFSSGGGCGRCYYGGRLEHVREAWRELWGQCMEVQQQLWTIAAACGSGMVHAGGLYWDSMQAAKALLHMANRLDRCLIHNQSCKAIPMPSSHPSITLPTDVETFSPHQPLSTPNPTPTPPQHVSTLGETHAAAQKTTINSSPTKLGALALLMSAGGKGPTRAYSKRRTATIAGQQRLDVFVQKTTTSPVKQPNPPSTDPTTEATLHETSSNGQNGDPQTQLPSADTQNEGVFSWPCDCVGGVLGPTHPTHFNQMCVSLVQGRRVVRATVQATNTDTWQGQVTPSLEWADLEAVSMVVGWEKSDQRGVWELGSWVEWLPDSEVASSLQGRVVLHQGLITVTCLLMGTPDTPGQSAIITVQCKPCGALQQQHSAPVNPATLSARWPRIRLPGQAQTMDSDELPSNPYWASLLTNKALRDLLQRDPELQWAGFIQVTRTANTYYRLACSYETLMVKVHGAVFVGVLVQRQLAQVIEKLLGLEDSDWELRTQREGSYRDKALHRHGKYLTYLQGSEGALARAAAAGTLKSVDSQCQADPLLCYVLCCLVDLEARCHGKYLNELGQDALCVDMCKLLGAPLPEPKRESGDALGPANTEDETPNSIPVALMQQQDVVDEKGQVEGGTGLLNEGLRILAEWQQILTAVNGRLLFTHSKYFVNRREPVP